MNSSMNSQISSRMDSSCDRNRDSNRDSDSNRDPNWGPNWVPNCTGFQLGSEIGSQSGSGMDEVRSTESFAMRAALGCCEARSAESFARSFARREASRWVPKEPSWSFNFIPPSRAGQLIQYYDINNCQLSAESSIISNSSKKNLGMYRKMLGM